MTLKPMTLPGRVTPPKMQIAEAHEVAAKSLSSSPISAGNGSSAEKGTSNRVQDKRSIFLVSLIAFLAINITCSISAPFDFDPYKFIYHGWAWWILDDLRHDRGQHNLALLGSSLMVSAVAGCDANFLNKPIDLSRYHKASYLDNLLSTTFNGTFNTFNLSAPGQMPSDAYLTLQAMVNANKRPDIVIYGVAPRDFIDSTLSSPTDTEPFRYLKRIVNIDDVAGQLYRSPMMRLDWFLQRNIYFYQYSLDLQMSINRKIQKALAILVPAPPTKTPFTWWDRQKLLPNYLGGELIPGSMVAGPLDRKILPSSSLTIQEITKSAISIRNPIRTNRNFTFCAKLPHIVARKTSSS